MLNRREILMINENIKYDINDLVFIHHPITGDIVKVSIIENKYSSFVVSIPEDSDYFGQPDFEIKKYKIISKYDS